MVLIVIILAWLGLSAGSFVNALVWRLHENKRRRSGKKLSIVNGRSMCPRCKHQLAWYDLVPVLSWIILKGKCRYCKKPVSIQYPLVELITGLVFVASYLFWPHEAHLNGQWLLLAAWLASSVGLIALAVYDLRWMLLPSRIIYSALAVAAAGRLLYIILFSGRPLRSLLFWALSIAVASGIFYVLYSVNDKLIGFGDVRLGLVTGTLLGTPQASLAMIFIASLLGTLVAVPSLVQRQRNLASRLPYGPFLIFATAVMVVFGEPLLDWYGRVLGIR